MAHYGPGPGYPAPSSQGSGRGGWKSWLPLAVAGGTQVGMVRVQAQVDPRHAWMLLLFVPPQRRMAWLYPVSTRRRWRTGRVMSDRAKASQVKASHGRHASALIPHTSHVSTGWRGWGGGTVMRHGWRISSPHGRVHGGSRDPAHAFPPRTNSKCRFCIGIGIGIGFGFGSSSSSSYGDTQHQPPQPAEHPPRYTQAIASPPGPLKPCNINGLKGKSAP